MSTCHRSLRALAALRRGIHTTSRVARDARDPLFHTTSRVARDARDPLFRPSPPPLPAADQREWEELVKTAQQPASSPSQHEDDIHPDARRNPEPEFQGNVNPKTGEVNGPKVEPVKHNDWSYAGRVTDF